jgi:F420-0:gamma-glutamyl ligase-like protein
MARIIYVTQKTFEKEITNAKKIYVWANIFGQIHGEYFEVKKESILNWLKTTPDAGYKYQIRISRETGNVYLIR